jgi:hypothetical protein
MIHVWRGFAAIVPEGRQAVEGFGKFVQNADRRLAVACARGAPSILRVNLVPHEWPR